MNIGELYFEVGLDGRPTWVEKEPGRFYKEGVTYHVFMWRPHQWLVVNPNGKYALGPKGRLRMFKRLETAADAAQELHRIDARVRWHGPCIGKG